MAAPIPDERRLILIDKTFFVFRKIAAGHHPGEVKPSTADGVPINLLMAQSVSL